jgi:ABC-2 type transport system permease protein
MLIFTSLGAGFFFSLVAETEIQAVQYSMLLLLASIFFSGFFLDLRMMWEPVRAISWVLPTTYAIRLVQDVMLRGYSAGPQLVAGLAGIGILLFIVDWYSLRRKIRQA